MSVGSQPVAQEEVPWHKVEIDQILLKINIRRRRAQNKWTYFYCEQYGLGLDIVLEEWCYPTMYPPRNVSPSHSFLQKIQSGRHVSSPSSDPPKNASLQVSYMPWKRFWAWILAAQKDLLYINLCQKLIQVFAEQSVVFIFVVLNTTTALVFETTNHVSSGQSFTRTHK